MSESMLLDFVGSLGLMNGDCPMGYEKPTVEGLSTGSGIFKEIGRQPLAKDERKREERCRAQIGQRYRSTTDDLAYVCLASAGCPISRKYKYRTFRGRGFYHEGDAPD